ncbi:MAG: alpha/beta fold hydrolase, partial [Deinococcales bacterium]
MRLAVPRNPTRRPDDAAAPALAARARRARLRVAAAALVVFALGWGLSQNVPLDPFATVGPGPSPSPSGAGTAAPGGAPSGSSTGAADRSVPAVPGAPLVAAPSGAVAPAAGPPVARPLNVRNGPVVLSGTLLLPSGPGPFPAVVLLPGRGASARDQAAADARLFATHGIAAYAYDKRGAGGSTGDWRSSLALNDEVGDAVAAVAAVRRQPGIDPSRVGVWGLGQGAWLAPFVGEHADVAVLILLNSSAAPLGQEEVWNAGDAVRARGYSPTAADAAMRAVRLLVSTRPVLAALLPHDQLGFLKDVPASNPADALHRAKAPALLVYDDLNPRAAGAKATAQMLRAAQNRDQPLDHVAVLARHNARADGAGTGGDPAATRANAR